MFGLDSLLIDLLQAFQKVWQEEAEDLITKLKSKSVAQNVCEVRRGGNGEGGSRKSRKSRRSRRSRSRGGEGRGGVIRRVSGYCDR